jgi:hypothetical protein
VHAGTLIEPQASGLLACRPDEPVSHAGEQYLSFVSEVIYEPRQCFPIQLGIHIIHHHRQSLSSFPFDLIVSGEPEGCCHYLGLARAEHVPHAPSLRLKAQVMAVGTIDGISHLTVPNARLIIPFLETFFHLILTRNSIQPTVHAVGHPNVESAISGYRRVETREVSGQPLRGRSSGRDDARSGSRQRRFPQADLVVRAGSRNGGIPLPQRSLIGSQRVQMRW